MQRVQVFCLVTITLVLTGYLLWLGSRFFLPLACAGVLAYFILATASAIQGVSVRGHILPKWLAMTLTCVLFIGATLFAAQLVSANIRALATALPTYQELLSVKLDHLSDVVGFSLRKEYAQLFEKVDVVWATTLLLSTVTDLASSTGLIFIYVIFFLAEGSFFHQKLEALLPEPMKRAKALTLVDKVISKINRYIKIKTLVSLLTAACSYAVLRFVGLDFAAACAFLIFAFNYIPNLGAIIATVLPVTLSFVQFDTYGPMIWVAVLLTSIQFAIGNFFEPRLMGRSFNLSGLLIILSLIIWGYLWGIIGMVLSVPIMVIVSIVLANFPQTRQIAVLMSQDGRID